LYFKVLIYINIFLQKGDQIYVTRRLNEEWLEGTLNKRTGMFPMSYVELIEPLSEESSYNQEICKVIAVFAFKPECWEDLSIQVICTTTL